MAKGDKSKTKSKKSKKKDKKRRKREEAKGIFGAATQVVTGASEAVLEIIKAPADAIAGSISSATISAWSADLGRLIAGIVANNAKGLGDSVEDVAQKISKAIDDRIHEILKSHNLPENAEVGQLAQSLAGGTESTSGASASASSDETTKTAAKPAAAKSAAAKPAATKARPAKAAPKPAAASAAKARAAKATPAKDGASKAATAKRPAKASASRAKSSAS